jgi:hypothetical protein
MMKALLFLCGISAQAATLTVCASGCGYTDFQLALNAAVRGDVIELKAGETFEGNFRLPWKGAGSGYVTVRSSRWAELPAPGNRVGSAHTALMPKVQPVNTSTAAIYAVPEEKYDCTANTSTDVITCPTHGFADGDPLTQRWGTGTPYSPFVMGTIYYARDTTSTTFKVAATPGGAALDISGTSTTDTWRWQTLRVGSNYKFVGIEFSKKAGQDTLYNLVEIGRGEEYVRAGIPSNFVFDRVYIHGIRDEEGPNICMMLNARNVTIQDSTIENCIKSGSESKAITFSAAPGPMTIRNNTLNAGSITLLTGGAGVIVDGLVSGDEGQILIEGNLFTRPLWQKYTAGTGGAGAPSGACSDGAYYLNVSNGQWYVCKSSAWQTAPTCADGEYYRRTDVAQNCGSGACWSCASGVFTSYGTLRSSSYATKNLFEIKSAKNVVVRGNIFENNWVNSNQSGIAVWLTSQVSQYNANGWVRGENIRFERNIIRRSSKGLRIASEGGTTFGVNNNRLQVRDVLMHEVGTNTTYPSLSDQDGEGLSFGGPCDDCLVDHVTAANVSIWGKSVVFDTSAFARPRLSNTISYRNQYGYFADLGNDVSYYWGSGNVLNTVAIDNLGNGTGSIGAYAANGKYIAAGTTMFVGSGNYRLQTTSPYSAACVSGCDYAATDGKDLGADIDAVESATGGASSGAPWLGGSMRVTVGSTRAIVRYTAPDANSCTLKLYTNIGRTTLHGDTDTGGEQADTRTGNITVGRERQFVLGGNTALTASTRYWAVITCGSSIGLAEVVTRSAGSGTYNVVTRYKTAVSGEYSSSADMSSPTAISSATTHTVPVPTGAVRYYRQTGGSISAMVAP